MNFKKWIICLISLAILIMTPMVCYLALEASNYGFKVIIAPKALIFLTILIFVISIVAILGKLPIPNTKALPKIYLATIYNRADILIFIVYSNLILFVFILIFGIGAVTFTSTMESWIFSNWDRIRGDVYHLNLDQFRENFNNSVISLGFFAFTISLGQLISIVAILFWIPIEKFLESVISSFAIIFIVFSSATIIITYQIKNTIEMYIKVSEAEEIALLVSIINSLILTLAGCCGYYASLKNYRKLIIFYLSIMVITSLLLFCAGCSIILISEKIEEEIKLNWKDISDALGKDGFRIPIHLFVSTTKEALVFAGLFGLAFFLFNVVGISTSYYQLKNIKKEFD